MSDNLNRAYIGMPYVLALAGAVPLCLAYSFDSPSFGIEAFAAFGIVLWSSFRLASLGVRGEKRLITMTFWIYVYIFLGLSPMLQLMDKTFPLAGRYSAETIVLGFSMIIAGLLSYELGRHLLLLKFGAFINHIIMQFDKRTISLKKVFYFSIFAILVTSVLINMTGGVRTIILPRHQRVVYLMEFVREEGQAKYQMLSTFLRVPVFVAFISLWALRLHNSKKNNNPLTLRHKTILFILLAFNVLVNNPVNSSRFWFGTIVLSLAFITLKWRKASFAIISFIIIMLFIFIFPFADMFRHTTDIDIKRLTSKGSITYHLVNKGDYDSFQQILNTVNYVKSAGLSFGRQFTGSLLFWFPRSIWENKPISSGQLVAEKMGYTNRNLSQPLWGEAYLDAGILGIILVFIGYGFLTTAIENFYLERHKTDLTFFSTLVPFFAAYQFFLLRGCLMTAFAYLVPLVLFLFLVTEKIRFQKRQG
jgi:hypothetical protein